MQRSTVYFEATVKFALATEATEFMGRAEIPWHAPYNTVQV